MTYPVEGEPPDVFSEEEILFTFPKGGKSFDYDTYVEIQSEANRRKIGLVWAKEENIAVVSGYLKANLAGGINQGICHGTRSGLEQKWFRHYLGCEVWGTELSETAVQFEFTYHWDFHRIRPEWKNFFDFVYSNSFDHSYDPIVALEAWMASLRMGGVCVIEHSDRHEPAGASQTDPFGITLEGLVRFVNRIGAGRWVVEDLISNFPAGRPYPQYTAALMTRKLRD